jgi:sporulation-control protein spo0M
MTLAAAALLTAGCGGSDSAQSTPTSPSPSTVSPQDMSNEQAPPTRLEIEVTIKGGEVTPTNEQLQAGVNEQIIIRVNSDVADELHVHSNPEHTFKIEPKPAQSFQFTVNVPGKVDVELHQLNRVIATIEVQ